MTTTVDTHLGQPPEGPPPSDDSDAALRRAERFFFTGVVLTGTLLLAPIGLPILGYGAYQLRKIEKLGVRATRPWHVSVIGAFAIIDAAGNFIGWSFCTYSARTGLMWSIFRDGYGHSFDGFYYADYGSSWMIRGVDAPGEQSYIFMATLVLWPMRLAAAWAFLKMKRWAFRWMITTSWMLVLFWVGWTTNGLMHFDERFGEAGGSIHGILGWWLFNSVFIFGPVVMIPYLYTVNRELWNEE